MERRKVKVLVVDDSAFMRIFLSEIIADNGGLELAATASRWGGRSAENKKI